MPNGTESVIEFPGLGRKKIQAVFSGGTISSDAGALLQGCLKRLMG